MSAKNTTIEHGGSKTRFSDVGTAFADSLAAFETRGAGIALLSVAFLLTVGSAHAQEPCDTVPAAATSDAYGESVDLTVTPAVGAPVTVTNGPLPSTGGSAPQSYANTNEVPSTSVSSMVTGPVLDSNTITVNAASTVPASAGVSADTSINDLSTGVGGMAGLSITADTVESSADVQGPCGGPLTPTGTTTFTNPSAGGAIGTGLIIPENPAPNTVLLDENGIRVILNEQILSGDGFSQQTITVNAIHIIFDGATVLGPAGDLSGDIILGHSSATLICGVTGSTALGNGSATGGFGDMVLAPVSGTPVAVSVDPAPVAAGAAPTTYDNSSTAASVPLSIPPIGDIISAGTTTVHAQSDVPGTDTSSSDAIVNSFAFGVPGAVGVDADSIASVATIDGPCGGPLTATGASTFTNAVPSGTLGSGLSIPTNPAPNTILLDMGGVFIILNEQIPFGDGITSQGLTVNAMRIALTDVDVPGVGTLNGDYVTAQSIANLQCVAADPLATCTPSATPTSTPTLTPTMTSTSTATATPTLTATITFTPTISSTPTISATPTNTVPTPDPATIVGVVFNDLDSNGVQDVGDLGIGGVTVELIDPDTGTVVATTTTLADGSYEFLGVPPGTYFVRTTDLDGYRSTTANTVTVTAISGETASSDFGDVFLPNCGNGTVDADETCDPIGGVNPPNSNLCRSDCTFCGDSAVNGPPGVNDPGNETCDDGDALPFNTCANDCSGRLLRDPATIRFRRGRATHDRFKVNGRILPQTPISKLVNFDGAPNQLCGRRQDGCRTQPVTVVLRNASDEMIYRGELAQGLTDTSPRLAARQRFKFRDRHAKNRPGGGIAAARIYPHRDSLLVYLVAYGDLSDAVDEEMYIELYLGDQMFGTGGNWLRRNWGWLFLDPPVATLAVRTPSATPSGANTPASATPTPPSGPDPGTGVTDLSLMKTTLSTFTIGGQGTYKLQITNLGPWRTNGPITVTDVLPGGLSVVSVDHPGYVCNVTSGAVACTSDVPLEAGAAANLVVFVHVDESAYPTVTNTARVSYALDTDPSNDVGSRPTTIRLPR